MAAVSEKNNSIKALLLSIGIHALLLLVLFLMVFKNPDPPLFADNSGVEVNFGFSDEGMGEVQPLTETNPASIKKTSTAASTEKVVKSTQAESKLVTQQTEEAPVLEEKKTSKPVEVRQPVKEEVKQPVVNENALYKKRTKSTTEQGEGETGKPGDQGIKEGSIYSKVHGKVNGTGDHGTGDGSEGNGGGGTGKGYQFSLAGRRLMMAPAIDDRSQETGKVVVSITVDKNGNVTKAIPGARGSTTTNSMLYTKAREAALKAKFNANPEAAEEQNGTITFIFLVR